MRIEVAKEGRMDMSGQGLLRAIQNNNMPLLDLFVRESVQNSLDAGKKDAKFVRVDFGIGHFNSMHLADEFDGISKALQQKFGETQCDYLFVRDKNTDGLTGSLHFSDKDDSESRNLLKLVYEIAKPQENKGSGGSWGYGKTIYFRVGIGLVIYYSRIKLENGEYQSRLAACLVEDEKRPDALLSDPSLNSHRGLAWWGEEFEFNSSGVREIGTIPITDEGRISKFLDIFGFDKFIGDETGTAIIIPYIDRKRLLRNNISEDIKDVPWLTSVESYLKIAVQRWYIGRLNNPTYTKKQKQPWLQAAVGNEVIKNEDMAEPFMEIQKLYNLALTHEERDDDYHCKPVLIRKYFRSTKSGYIAYKMYSKEEMGMLPPNNNPNPFYYVKNEDGTDDFKDGDIILTYFRKPGMAVTYDTAGEWVNKIKVNNEKTGDILIAVYVLNSSNKFSGDHITELETIEDYFRASEKADHAAWFDINVNDTYPRLLAKIQQGVRKRINETYKEVQETPEQRSSSLSKMFGEFFLPPQGFGKRASRPAKKPGGGERIVKHKDVKVIVREKDIEIQGNSMILPVTIEASKPVNNLGFVLEVAADGKNIPLSQWKDKVGIEVPFYINGGKINTIQTEKRIISRNLPLIDKIEEDSYGIALLKNIHGDAYGLTVSSEYKDILITMNLEIRIQDFAAEMKYMLKEGE